MGLFNTDIKKLESSRNISALLKHTKNRKAEIRFKAYHSLVKLLPADEILQNLQHMLHDDDSRIRTIVAIMFSELGYNEAFENLRAIIYDGSSNEKIRMLLKLTDVSADKMHEISNILALALNDKNPHVQAQALKTISSFNTSMFLSLMASKLQDKNAQVRLEAVRALCKTSPEEAVDYLLGALIDSDREVRKAARLTLEAIDSERTREMLRNAPFMLLVKNMNDSALKREETADHIGKHKIQEAIPLLHKACNDEYKNIRIKAVRAIGNMHDEVSLPVVIKMLEDKYFDVRLEAVRTLEKIFDPVALSALEKARSDSNRDVRLEAERAYYNLRSRLEREKNDKR